MTTHTRPVATRMQTAPLPYAAAAFTNGYEFTEGSGYQLPEYPFVEPPEIATGECKRHPIVIVGGGITGLSLACALAQYGVRALLLDEDNTVGVKGASSRGICYAQKTLEIFKRLGIYERIAAKGVQWSVGRTFAGHDEVYSFDLRQQATHRLERVHDLLSRSARKARWMNCRLVLRCRSQFFHRRLFLSSQAKLRSTTQRLGMTAN